MRDACLSAFWRSFWSWELEMGLGGRETSCFNDLSPFLALKVQIGFKTVEFSPTFTLKQALGPSNVYKKSRTYSLQHPPFNHPILCQQPMAFLKILFKTRSLNSSKTPGGSISKKILSRKKPKIFKQTTPKTGLQLFKYLFKQTKYKELQTQDQKIIKNKNPDSKKAEKERRKKSFKCQGNQQLNSTTVEIN